jgi:Ras-related GTP-binding protein C/D
MHKSTHAIPAPAAPKVHRTKILLLGSRRSGKTSIRQVLFGQMSAKETFYLERTTRIVKHAYDTVIPAPESLGVPLSAFGAMIFVLDIQV